MLNQLAIGDVHLWLVYYDQITDEQLLVDYRALLNGSELKREQHFHFAGDRRRYLVTRAPVRTVLSRYVPVSPADWIFFKNVYGRPEPANIEARDVHLSFNISHTQSLIVLGVTRKRALGVDVENVSSLTVLSCVADLFFAAEEVA